MAKKPTPTIDLPTPILDGLQLSAVQRRSLAMFVEHANILEKKRMLVHNSSIITALATKYNLATSTIYKYVKDGRALYLRGYRLPKSHDTRTWGL
jgi:hypothetical protein